jgi:Fur family transcriptional regulator, ferric uptake regulator
MARKARISAAILELMRSGERHAWTLEELHSSLASKGAATDFSSVFRAAEKLGSDGLVRKLLLEDGRARFELVGAHHDHLYCMRCRAIVPIPCVIEAADFAVLERATGAAIIEHHLVLTGICRACRKAAPRKARRQRVGSAASARRRR